MSTKAIYRFWDNRNRDEEYFVYKHYDNYPQGAVHHIQKATAHAWPFPRYEADEFASAFVAANKNPRGGEVRLISNHLKDKDEVLSTHRFCDYFYDIHYAESVDHEGLWIEVHGSRYVNGGSEVKWDFFIWSGFLEDMRRDFTDVE